MNKRNRILNKLKIISLISSISFISLSILFLSAFLIKEIPVLSLLFKDYIEGGKSLFFPFLPEYNLLMYIPDNAPPMKYTVGQLMDTIMVINLYCYLETSVYHYIKKAYRKEDDLVYIESPYLIKESEFITIFNKPERAQKDSPEMDQENYYTIEDKSIFRDDKKEKNKLKPYSLVRRDRKYITDNTIILLPSVVFVFYPIFDVSFSISLFLIKSLNYDHFSVDQNSSFVCQNDNSLSLMGVS